MLELYQRANCSHSGDNLRTPSLLGSLVFTLEQFHREGSGNLGRLAGSGAGFYLYSRTGLKCGVPGGLRFVPPIPSRCWRSRSGRFEVGGSSALCRGQRASGMLARAVQQSRSVCLGALRSPICLLRRAPRGVLRSAQGRPGAAVAPAHPSHFRRPHAGGQQTLRTRPFSKVHTLNLFCKMGQKPLQTNG